MTERPNIQMTYLRERHSALLNQARNGELAAAIAKARRIERRSLLSRLHRRRAGAQPTPSTS